MPSSGQLSTGRVGVGVGRKQEARGPSSRSHRVIVTYTPRAWLWARGQQPPLPHSAKSRATASRAPRSADSGLPSALGQKKKVWPIQL